MWAKLVQYPNQESHFVTTLRTSKFHVMHVIWYLFYSFLWTHGKHTTDHSSYGLLCPQCGHETPWCLQTKYKHRKKRWGLRICLSVCLSVRLLTVCLTYCLSVCLSVCRLSVWLIVCQFLYVGLPACLPTSVFACRCLSVCLTLSVCLSHSVTKEIYSGFAPQYQIVL